MHFADADDKDGEDDATDAGAFPGPAGDVDDVGFSSNDEDGIFLSMCGCTCVCG